MPPPKPSLDWTDRLVLAFYAGFLGFCAGAAVGLVLWPEHGTALRAGGALVAAAFAVGRSYR